MLEIKKLSKKYNNKIIFKEANLTLNGGQILGLIGINGSGKSTLINCCLDLVKVDLGNILINGKEHTKLKDEDKLKIGIVAESIPLIDSLDARRYLKFIGEIYKMENELLNHRIESLLAYFFSENDNLKETIDNFSTGMRKKLLICSSMLHAPDLLFLDEPFSGLDEVSRRKVLNILKDYSNNKRSILITSHNSELLESIVTDVAVIENYNIINYGSIQNVTNNFQVSLREFLNDKFIDSSVLNISW
ncbi:ABC transporter ATP-binding protein [Flammeovirga aprica]|uniref:ABC transporter ATP-binding protein n=1 Tax=Flammeovirga aprica JL-4 TaxID=694437 RepID=A0A7X9S0Y8_9BACT|nr:ABC transporter ATP-binding protein [Flammeovirga aprica]NME72422.1 ABC transporter ATP-binding protein [Flammeovirga aprica JL-4]